MTYDRDYHHINQQKRHEGIRGAMELIETALIRKMPDDTKGRKNPTCRSNRHQTRSRVCGYFTRKMTSRLCVFNKKNKYWGYEKWRNKASRAAPTLRGQTLMLIWPSALIWIHWIWWMTKQHTVLHVAHVIPLKCLKHSAVKSALKDDIKAARLQLLSGRVWLVSPG